MIKSAENKSWIVYVSTYPPRECGIATFTQDLATKFNQLFAPSVETKVVAMNNSEIIRYHYPKKVIYHISQNTLESYQKTAEKLNKLDQVKLVNVQHEFGIFGGEYGSYLIDFAKNLTKPLVITFHTVLPSPVVKMRDTVRELTRLSKMIVVMTNRSKKILVEEYGLPEEKIKVVPHGIHAVPFESSKLHKAALGLSKSIVITNFGLLGPDKGLEYAIEALPPVVAKYPNLRFLILGSTHPEILKHHGEAYRNMLTKKVYELKLSSNVRFYDEYLQLEELLEFLQATDIYLNVSQKPEQAVSGTLSYGLGTGRPVISTAFAQAQETITPDVGRLVGFKNSKEITASLLELIGDENLRLAMGKTAYIKTRNMTWPNVAIAYMKMFSGIAPELKTDEKNLPKIKLSHFVKMTSPVGFYQFAELTKPDLRYGYTVDDNARALIAMAEYHARSKSPLALKLATIYLEFLKRTMGTNGYFRNYVNTDGTFNNAANTNESMEDPTGRALHGLAVAATTKTLPKRLRRIAHDMFRAILSEKPAFHHPRSQAFVIKAITAWLTIWEDESLKKLLITYCDNLVQLYKKNSPDNSWQWFEEALTYSNGLLPEALLAGYRTTGDKEYLRIAKLALDFLISQTFKEGMYVPIGHEGWFKRGGKRAYFSQQAEDPMSIILALKEMGNITKEERYHRFQQIAFSWFLGNNMLGQVVYDQTTGGSYDGIRENDLNLNEGAESSITYLISRLAMQNGH